MSARRVNTCPGCGHTRAHCQCESIVENRYPGCVVWIRDPGHTLPRSIPVSSWWWANPGYTAIKVTMPATGKKKLIPLSSVVAIDLDE